MASVIACGVNVEGGIRVVNFVMDFDVVVNVPLARAVNRYGLCKGPSWSCEPGAYIALASESTDGKSGQLESSISSDAPIFTVQEFPVGREFVHHSKGRLYVVSNGTGDVQTRPIGLTGKVEDDGSIVLEDKVKMAHSNVARGNGLNVNDLIVSVGLQGPC